MKILWITDDFLPHFGGSRILYYETIKCLPPEEVTVFTKRRPGWREFDCAQSFETRRGFFKKLPGPFLTRDLAIYAEMLACGAYWLKRSRADVIVCGELLPTGLAGRVLSALEGVPFIIYVHGEQVAVCEKLRGEGKIAFSTLRAADAVIASARDVRERALRHGVSEERLYLHPPGVGRGFLERRSEPERIISRFGLSGKKVILTVGRLVERKGHEMVIRALPRLIEECGETSYLIVGSGPMERRLRDLAEAAGVKREVVFAGRLSREELIDCYDACDVFVMPNRTLPDGDTEGAGIVFLEAEARGKPCVSGRAGGAVDSVRDGITGYCVDPESLEELTGRLSGLLKDRALARRLGAAGRRMIATERSWDERARELRKICGELVQKGSARRRKGFRGR